MSLPLYRRIPRCCSKFYTSSMIFALMRKARLPLCLFQKKESFLTIRQNSLNVTTCIFTSILSNTLPSRFRPNISITPGDWLLGSLAITYTGLSPASIGQLSWTHHIKKVLPTKILSKQYLYYVFDF